MSLLNRYLLSGFFVAFACSAFAQSIWTEPDPTAILMQITTAADGTTWGVSPTGRVYAWNGTKWKSMPGEMKMVSAGNKDEIWGVNFSDNVYRWNGKAWDVKTGSVSQIAVGADGSVWGINAGSIVMHWTGKDWERMPGSLSEISVGTNEIVWGLSANNMIYHWNGQEWENIPGNLAQISAASDGTVWGSIKAAKSCATKTKHGTRLNPVSPSRSLLLEDKKMSG